eukprot:TRINITY_DN3638_c0_g1_i2.p1 TRINITY_DN3638_c0_g1~~TRINITY_DN3638_c0_g1_i2.p1  ORF type:complete len:320 (-),score=68.10 TRINITY_DN3638_c0_g1_i2:39-998(-)
MSSLVRVLLLGCPGVGKRSLVKEIMRHMSDGDAADYEEPDVQQLAVINGQKVLLECEDIFVEDEETEDPNAPLMGGRAGSSARFLRGGRGGNRAPLKKAKGPNLRKKPNVFDKANNTGQAGQKAKATPKRAGSDKHPTSYVLVFDIGDVKSFEEAERQMEKLAGAGNHIILVGNKTDKARRYRRITYEEGSKLAGRIPHAEVKYIESSAKLNQRVDQIFIEAVKKIQGSMSTSQPHSNSTQSTHEQQRSGSAGSDPLLGGDEESETNESLWEKCCQCCSDDNGAEDAGVPSNCCAKYCKCCPRPVYTRLKKCGKCCTIM